MFRQVAVPVTLLIIGSLMTGWIVIMKADAGFLRICLTTGATGIVTLVIGWFGLFSSAEQKFVRNLICNGGSRLRALWGG